MAKTENVAVKPTEVKVRFLVSLAGIGFSYNVGQVELLDSDSATQLIEAGYAVKV